MHTSIEVIYWSGVSPCLDANMAPSEVSVVVCPAPLTPHPPPPHCSLLTQKLICTQGIFFFF